MPVVDGRGAIRPTVGEVDDDQDVAFGVDPSEAGAVAAAVAALGDPVLEEPEAGSGVTGDAVSVEAEDADAVAVGGHIGGGERILDVVLVLNGRGRVLLPEPARDVADILGRASGEDVVTLAEAVGGPELVVSPRCRIAWTVAVGVDLIPVVGCLGRGVAVELEGRRVSDVAHHPVRGELRDDWPQGADDDVQDECESCRERAEGMKPGMT